MADLYQIKTDYPLLANAKAAALTRVNAHWGFVFDVKINGEPYFKRRIQPNAQGVYTLTATTTYSTHPCMPASYWKGFRRNDNKDESMNDLVRYHIARPGIPLGPIEASLYEYILAGNGIFIRGERKEFRAQFCIQPFEVRGLADLALRVEMKTPRVPEEIVSEMLGRARTAHDAQGERCEIVFHLEYESGHWLCHVPEQIQSPMRAKPKDDSPGSTYARACIEVHSHIDMHARFSSQDDEDEQGFRLFGVLGCISTQPVIRMRVGLYGYQHDIPASWILDPPLGMGDAVTGEGTILGSMQ